MADPISQFELKTIAPLVRVGETMINFTNSSLFMVMALATICFILIYGTRQQAVVPGRLQSLAEMAYEFIANTVRSGAGNEGMRFFPLVFSLFMFILVLNMFGMVPGFFTVTSHIVITFALALLVILTVFIYGVSKHGLHFFHLFAPSGVPILLLPIIIMIEIMSFLSRPFTLGLRLFANMLGGHIAMKVFASFIIGLGTAAGIAKVLAPLPFFVIIALTALEFLVAFLQAYVFAVLTTIYLNDALHPHH
jgi:F-type H+-transporting ATPase subunit a